MSTTSFRNNNLVVEIIAQDASMVEFGYKYIVWQKRMYSPARELNS